MISKLFNNLSKIEKKSTNQNRHQLLKSLISDNQSWIVLKHWKLDFKTIYQCLSITIDCNTLKLFLSNQSKFGFVKIETKIRSIRLGICTTN